MANETDITYPIPTESTALVSGIEVAVRALATADISLIFGGGDDPVMASLAYQAKAAGILFAHFQDEMVAHCAALSCTMLSGKPKVLVTVSRSRSVDGLVRLSITFHHRQSMVEISGSCDRADFGEGSFQKATTISEIPCVIFTGLASSAVGCGGCYIGLPADVMVHETIYMSEASSLSGAKGTPAPILVSEEQTTLDLYIGCFERAKGIGETLKLHDYMLGLLKKNSQVMTGSGTGSSVDHTRMPVLNRLKSNYIFMRLNEIAAEHHETVGEQEIKNDPFCLEKTHPIIEAISKEAMHNISKRDEKSAQGTLAPALVSEGTKTMDVSRAVLVQSEPWTTLDAGTRGTMGVGLGCCIAAATAEPNRLVVAVEGDLGSVAAEPLEVEEPDETISAGELLKATSISEIPSTISNTLATAVAGHPGGCSIDHSTDILQQSISEVEAVSLLSGAASGSPGGGYIDLSTNMLQQTRSEASSHCEAVQTLH